MEFLKKQRSLCGFFLIAAGLLCANRGCEKPVRVEHPPLEQGMGCAACHDDGRTRETRPPGHNSQWIRGHGEFIHQNGFKTETYCTVCHNQSQCSRCHQQEAPRNHTEFWRLKGHGIAAGLDRASCFTCHHGVDSCQRCHATTAPLDHSAAWGAPSNRHCLGCHFPLTSAGAERCAVCHTGTPSHASAPPQPANALHISNANCQTCHTPLRHPDNGMACAICHPRR